MTDEDKELINMAERLPACDWYYVQWLSEQTENEELSRALKDIATAKYHIDEYLTDFGSDGD